MRHTPAPPPTVRFVRVVSFRFDVQSTYVGWLVVVAVAVVVVVVVTCSLFYFFMAGSDVDISALEFVIVGAAFEGVRQARTRHPFARNSNVATR
jgi:hypothetical protein